MTFESIAQQAMKAAEKEQERERQVETLVMQGQEGAQAKLEVVVLPCPRCKKKPSLKKTKHSYYVKCSCGLEGKHFRKGNGLIKSKQFKAISWWNKRQDA